MNVDSEKKSAKVTFVAITEAESGQRVDNFLFRQFKHVPKSRIYKAIRGGEVRVNKKRVKQTSKLMEGDLLRIPPLVQDEKPVTFVNDGLKAKVASAILFEDTDLIVVNKPSGLAVHGGSGVDLGLIEVLRALRPECKRLTLVHRLDRETSGCIVLAKKNSVLRALHHQLREKTMQKGYLALVKGRWPRRKTLVDMGLEKNILESGERMVKASLEGKRSKTRFGIEEALVGATLINAEPITGRTHQIRVHAQYAGFPLLGDQKYGDPDVKAFESTIELSRLFLHAQTISFEWPAGKMRTFKAPLSADLKKVLDKLRSFTT